MLKKFVPLDGGVSPSQTPYDIKTYKCPTYEEVQRLPNIDPCCYGTPLKKCMPENNPTSITKPITTEEAILRLLEVPQKPRFQRSCKKRCKYLEPYTACVMEQRTPKILKQHAIVREKYLKAKADTMQRVHDAQDPLSDAESLIQMNSLIVTDARVKPKPASPTCSLETFYVPSRKLLDLKRPRSGIFINETGRPVYSSIPYETYDPRKLQEQLDSEGRKKYTLFSEGDRFYFPWMQGPSGVSESRRDQPDDLRNDCINFKPFIFHIPNDLHKTFRVNVLFSNEALPAHIASNGPQRPVEVACLYSAYVQSFSQNPDYWSAKAMDSIIQSGTALCKKSIETGYENPEEDFDIIPEITEKEAKIGMKLHLTGVLADEPNILKALTLFFHKFHAGVLRSENLYFLMWKRCADTFYIFDPNGRDVQCKRDFNAGKASLMAIQTVEHIVHLILNYSSISDRSDFDLYEIYLKDFGKLSKPCRFERVKPAKKRYAVVNQFYAVIPALSGLPSVSAGKSVDDNASMMISYLALIYSQIDPPREWTMQLVDDLIKFGKKYHSDYMCDNRLRKLNVVDLPEVLFFGNFRILVEKKPFVASTHVVECRSYRASQLTLAMKNFFTECNTGLLQVDCTTLGLWKERKIFFVFDPFKRGPAGQASVPSKTGVGCLQIHLNIDSLCRMLFMNSIAVRTEGNFFLHEIRVKAIGTFNINQVLKDATGFGTLQIKYPFDCEGEQQLQIDCSEKPLRADILNCTLAQCLSELSVSPCERTCSEREFLQLQKKMALRNKLSRVHSIQSIPEQYKIPEFDDVDVVDFVVDEFICDLMTKIERKAEKKPKVNIEASKILLQSDKSHLEDLRERLKRGEDYDNVCAAFKTKPPGNAELTFDEELAIKSNFTSLPDGSWAIFGLTDLDIGSEALKGILSTIIAAALSSKYNLSTWSSDIIEYALEACAALEERFWSYNHTLDLIFRKQIPKIQLGSTTHYIKVITNATVLPDKLKETLDGILLRVNRLFLICRGLSCLIVKRYNFLYMFMGCSCDVVGFRSKSPGPMCLLRFSDMNALVRRVENACGRCAKYVIVQLEVKDITEPRPERFEQRTMSQEELVYERELNKKKAEKQRYKEKMTFIQHEIRKESKRVKQFQEEKRRAKLSITIPQATPEVTQSLEGEYGEEEELYEQSEGSVEFKHKPGKSLEKPEEQEIDKESIIPTQLGYQLRDADCFFKIQGSTALEDRLETSVDRIKTCFFASAISLLYAILRPLNQWDSRRVDKVIHVAKNIAKTTINFNTASERIIKNIDVDEFTFQVKAEVFVPMGSFGGNLEYKIMKTIQKQRYFLIQIANGTFAVYRDKYFHLFDPYPSMEIAPEQENTDEEGPQCSEDIARQPEQNTASWVLFGDLTAMLDYIQKRATRKNWKTEYQLHVVSIISYKAAPKRVQLLNLLTDEFDICPKTPESANLCTHAEEIEWLDIYPNLVIWSRLNRSNSVQRVRGSTLTKDRNFDIEIPDKLYSLWGSIHPLSAVFGQSRGKQHLAIDVVACCIASVYRVNDWNTQILDSIVINGHDFYVDSVSSINRKDYEISLEHLNTVFQMGHLYFEVHLESVAYGYLYERAKKELNLAAALAFFFTKYRYGIIQCMRRSVAVGKLDSGFFMFECQSQGLPLFPSGQGAAYVLRASQLQILLYCIVMTFNIPYYYAQFTIHKVEMISERLEQEEDKYEEE